MAKIINLQRLLLLLLCTLVHCQPTQADPQTLALKDPKILKAPKALKASEAPVVLTVAFQAPVVGRRNSPDVAARAPPPKSTNAPSPTPAKAPVPKSSKAPSPTPAKAPVPKSSKAPAPKPSQ